MKGSKFKRKNLYQKQKGRCYYCGIVCTLSTNKKDKKDFFTLDHVVPKKHGGIDLMDNLVGACRQCNGIKGCNKIDDFLTIMGQL